MRALAVIIFIVMLVPLRTHAATFVVDDTGQAADANPGDGTCDTGTGKCTLVAAIGEANAHADADVIQVMPATYTFTATLPTVTTAMTIQPTTGSDPSATVIQSSNTGHPRLFSLTAGGDLTLDTLTLENAQTGPGSALQVTGASATLTNCVVTNNMGTALQVTGSSSLTLSGSTISHNTGATGGGMDVEFSNLMVSNTNFSENSASIGGAAYIYTASDPTHTESIAGSTFSLNVTTGSGGALYIGSDTLTINASTFDGNASGGGLYGGGAIYTTALGAGTVITNSTFTGNQASAASGGDGGAMFVLNRASCTGCTFFQNVATGSGGAVFAGANSGAEFDAVDSTFSDNEAFGGGAISTSETVKLASVTITKNLATGAHNALLNGSFGGGGGTNGTNVIVRNSIVAGNSSPLGGADCEGQITGPGYDLVGDDTNCSIVASPGPNQVGTNASPIDPGLGALAGNGGPTETCALLASSPAGEAGNPSGCTDNNGIALETDQRGQPRAVDGNSDGIARCDLGAYEAPFGTFPSPSTTTTTAPTTTSVPPPTTTSSTSTSVPPTTNTTTTTYASTTIPTTSTTLASDCANVPDGPTFASVMCRFESLLELVNESPGLGAFGSKSTVTLQKGLDRANEAQNFCSQSDAKHSKQRLKQVKRAAIQYAHRLSGLSARKKIDPTLRASVLTPVKPLEADVSTLRSKLNCPTDGES